MALLVILARGAHGKEGFIGRRGRFPALHRGDGQDREADGAGAGLRAGGGGPENPQSPAGRPNAPGQAEREKAHGPGWGHQWHGAARRYPAV